MKQHYSGLVRRLCETVLASPGATDPATRRAAEAHAAALGGRGKPSAQEVPATLARYIDTVARHAYKVTDEEIEGLRRMGYSEDAIFEITVSAALGASLGRLERGIAALRGEI